MSYLSIKHLLSRDKRVIIMGILNITPDSFYDGQRYYQSKQAFKYVKKMIDEGVDIIDVGAESSRPGANRVSENIELERITNILDIVKDNNVFYSIDTYKPKIAKFALENGFHIINDINGGGVQGKMFEVAMEFDAPIVIMHMKGKPKTMQESPKYENVIDQLKDFFEKRISMAKNIGLSDDQIIIDPGIGFGKRIEDNDTILNRISEFKMFGYPILLGLSRKSFLAIEDEEPSERLTTTICANTIAIENGVRILRVHDVMDAILCSKFNERMMINTVFI